MSWQSVLDQRVERELPDLIYQKEVPLAPYTSFRIGGPARRMAFPVSSEQLVLLVSFARDCGARPVILGKGSNVLCPDAGVDRLVIQTARGLDAITPQEDPCVIRADCGVSLRRLAEYAQQRGLTGFEFAHGIPGTLGGALFMNAGAYGGEMSQVTQRVWVLFPDEGIRVLEPGDLRFGYRTSVLGTRPEAVALQAEIRLQPGDPEQIRARMRDLMDRRKKSQPLEWPSAGSTFKRPEGFFAGTLIDQCGLKGLAVGGAQVSEKHAGFVINRGGASCADVCALIAQVQQRVYEAKGVHLEPEVRILEA